jgi:probable F420-dependent oxidoreductase
MMLMPPWRGSAEEIRLVAAAAEASGYHSIWVNEHIVIPAAAATRYPYRPDGQLPISPGAPWTEAMVTLGYLAGVTSSVRLGSAVIPIITRDPLSLAKQAATVDVVSGGRLELGLGAGWLVEEAEALGRPADRRAARLRETVEILRLAWTGDPFAYAGELYQIPEVSVTPRPAQGAELPIWIGGVSPAALGLAARAASGLILSISAMAGPERVAEIAATLRKDRPSVRLMAPVSVDEPGAPNRARALHQAGADIVMAVSYADATNAAVRLEAFAASV